MLDNYDDDEDGEEARRMQKKKNQAKVAALEADEEVKQVQPLLLPIPLLANRDACGRRARRAGKRERVRELTS